MRYPGDFFPAGNPRGIPAEANVVIVGGGLAGLELAKELQRRGTRDVVVLEAGSRGDGTHVNASAEAVEALEMWLNADEPSELWRPWTSATPPYYTRHGGLRRRLGGRSLYWHGVVLPIEPWALSAPAWPQRIVDDLTTSWLGGPGLYDVVRSELAAWTGGRGDEPPQLKVGDVVLSPTPKAIRRAGRPGGWEAYSPISYWSESGEAGGDEITLLPDCTVLGVAVRDGRTAGVVFREAESDAHITINSTRVVLAAGTIENARLAAQARRDAGSAAPPILSGLVGSARLRRVRCRRWPTVADHRALDVVRTGSRDGRRRAADPRRSLARPGGDDGTSGRRTDVSGLCRPRPDGVRSAARDGAR